MFTLYCEMKRFHHFINEPCSLFYRAINTILSVSYRIPLFKQSSFPPLLQALTWAARQGRKNVVLKLLELGANKTLRTKDGMTPSEVAKRNKHLEVSFYM